MHKRIDADRDGLQPRIEMHKKIDSKKKSRDQTQERINKHKLIDIRTVQAIRVKRTFQEP